MYFWNIFEILKYLWNMFQIQAQRKRWLGKILKLEKLWQILVLLWTGLSKPITAYYNFASMSIIVSYTSSKITLVDMAPLTLLLS